MTVIAAYKTPENDIYIAGDALAADPNDTIFTADPKVFGFNGFTFGYAGSFRFGQILNHCFLPPAHNPALDDSTYMFSVWLEALRETLDSYGLLKSENGVETIGEDGSALVAYRSNIYYVEQDLSVLKVATPYASIGSGCGYAIGAMYALQGLLLFDAIVEKAIEVAGLHVPNCGGKTTVVKHDPSTELVWVEARQKRKPRAPKVVEAHPTTTPLTPRKRVAAGQNTLKL